VSWPLYKYVYGLTDQYRVPVVDVWSYFNSHVQEARETYLVGSAVCNNERKGGRIVKLTWSGFSRMVTG
jgi:hypothetical protein